MNCLIGIQRKTKKSVLWLVSPRNAFYDSWTVTVTASAVQEAQSWATLFTSDWKQSSSFATPMVRIGAPLYINLFIQTALCFSKVMAEGKDKPHAILHNLPREIFFSRRCRRLWRNSCVTIKCLDFRNRKNLIGLSLLIVSKCKQQLLWKKMTSTSPNNTTA